MPLTSTRFSRNHRLQAAAENNPPMRKGEHGEAVQILQQALIDCGFDMPISTNKGGQTPDGIYGDETVNTVYKFQAREGLQRDGIAGRQTLTRLDQLFPPPVPGKDFPLPDVRKLAWTTARGGNV
jgi:peptidoglycan hydrolase-like protein with peptidoglycan-binding domain